MTPMTRSGSCKNVASEAELNCGAWTAVYGKRGSAGFCAATPTLDARVVEAIARRNRFFLLVMSSPFCFGNCDRMQTPLCTQAKQKATFGKFRQIGRASCRERV